MSPKARSVPFSFTLKRHTVTLFCVLLILQLLYFIYSNVKFVQGSPVLNDQKLKSHFEGVSLAIGFFSLIPFSGLLGSLGRFRLPTIVFLFSLLFIELPIYGVFLFIGFAVGGLKAMFTTEAGWHIIFGTAGGAVTLVVGILYLIELIKEDPRRRRLREVDEMEWR